MVKAKTGQGADQWSLPPGSLLAAFLHIPFAPFQMDSLLQSCQKASFTVHKFHSSPGHFRAWLSYKAGWKLQFRPFKKHCAGEPSFCHGQPWREATITQTLVQGRLTPSLQAWTKGNRNHEN